MIALPMPAQVEHLVLYIPPALTVQSKDLMLETLPLSLLKLRIIFSVRVIGTIDQAKIYCRLNPKSIFLHVERELDWLTYIIKGTCVGGRVVLKEIARNCGIFDRVRASSFRHGDNQRQQDGRHEKDRARCHDELVDRKTLCTTSRCSRCRGERFRIDRTTGLYGYIIDWIYERNRKLT